jgi:hypothetical protein
MFSNPVPSSLVTWGLEACLKSLSLNRAAELACIQELMRCNAIEWESEYLPLIVERLTKPMTIGFDFEYGI